MTISQLLERSSATPAFRGELLRFAREGRPSARIRFDAGAPPVKVERAVAKALVEYPELPIESIEVRGRSGCATFAGELVVSTAGSERRVAFLWDCRWRAEEQGWYDFFGFPDQARAAREFGWDCFREWLPEGGSERMEGAAAGGAAAVGA
jgi:hypothetical protein